MENVEWEGMPSQVSNFIYFFVCGILFFLIIPLLLILWRWLQTKCTKYELTSERLIMSHGVLNKTTDQLELYRVRDYRHEQPFFLRIFGLSNIVLISNDKTDKILNLIAIRDGGDLLTKIRTNVEGLRKSKSRII
ncbi:MAG: PH domain-containing protein [Moraxellaceae bacterium]|nr:PH domain-containing protein [Moraxellaceae bacterium]MBH2029142.1 PH domain-containing protein [Moraxellaceae bacterium]